MIRSLRLLLPLALLIAAVAEEEKPAGIDLRELLKPGNPVEPFGATPLVPEWIGIVREAGEKPDYIRLNYTGRDAPKDGKKGRIWVARLRSPDKSYSGGDRSNFYKTLPLAAEVKQATNLARLQHWFGPQQDWTGGWGDTERSNWSEGWSCFTRLEDGNLRWLGVFALVSSKREDIKNPALVRIDSIQVCEGVFRPADPGSAEEKKLYKTAEELHAEDLAEKEAKRAELPQPLRDLVAAHESPDDHGMATYRAALVAIRKDPKPELFRQIAALDDGLSGHSYLSDILFGNYLELEAWAPDKRKLAISHAIDALGKSPDPGKFQDQVIDLMAALGGGHMQIESPRIDLDVDAKGEGRWGYTQSGWDVEKENLAKAITVATAWLREKL